MAKKPAVETPAVETTPTAPEAKPTRKGMTKEQRAAYVAKSFTNYSPAPTAHITTIVPNPKRGDSAARFALYTLNMTVAEALAAGVWPADLRWDLAHKFIELN